MDFGMVAPNDLQSEPALQLIQGHGGVFFSLIGPAGGNIAGRRAGQ